MRHDAERFCRLQAQQREVVAQHMLKHLLFFPAIEQVKPLKKSRMNRKTCHGTASPAAAQRATPAAAAKTEQERLTPPNGDLPNTIYRDGRDLTFQRKGEQERSANRFIKLNIIEIANIIAGCEKTRLHLKPQNRTFHHRTVSNRLKELLMPHDGKAIRNGINIRKEQHLSRC
ncbi:hypothetical protein ACT6QG_02465 [Xanthobacter sp. TB0136]|uniref:hypothetical protein n=1 Tax=Xanthobacter sp. TB0136 TaxID=3459177 RepID=UPI00403A707C